MNEGHKFFTNKISTQHLTVLTTSVIFFLEQTKRAFFETPAWIFPHGAILFLCLKL